MEEVLSFINSNWVPCLYVNRHLEESIDDYYESREGGSDLYSDQTSYSCFFVPGYLGDILKIDTDQYQSKFQDCTYSIQDELKQGRMFIFDIVDHVFTVLFLSLDQIYYIDFFMETDRPKYFRCERITLDQLREYIHAMQTLDFMKISQFNQFQDSENAALGLEHDYNASVDRISREGSDRHREIFKYMIVDRSYIEHVHYHEISYLPTLSDILRVAYQSRDDLHSFIEQYPHVKEGIEADIQYLETKLL
jgi:hypothetical protein